jgi:hypothetical protein
MYFTYALPRVLSRINAVFASLFLGMHESRRRRADQIIREWQCDAHEDVRPLH